MEEEAVRRAAWLARGVQGDREGWPEGITRNHVIHLLESRDLWPWIPEGAPGVGLLLVRGAPVAPGRVAVVGGRASDAYGLACAQATALDAVALGLVVVSGGAEGCDAAAHQAALAAGGETVVVLPGGHDHPYPAAHASLFDEVVAAGGAVVSACWPTTRPTPWRFLARNRVIAALSDVCVVARARARSGALSTARAAREMGRPVLAVPGDVGEGWSEGGHQLLAAGGRPMTGSRSLVRALGREGGSTWPVIHRGSPGPWPPVPPPLWAPLSGQDLKVARLLLTHGILDPPALVRQTGLALHQVDASLLDLEVQGLVQSIDEGRFRWIGPEEGVGIEGF